MKRILFFFLVLGTFGFAQQKSPDERSIFWVGRGEFSLGAAVPGEIEVRGKSAFPVLKDGTGEKSLAAAGEAGKGRVVAFSHDAFFGGGTVLDQKSARDFLLHSLQWVGRAPNPSIALHPSAQSITQLVPSAVLVKPADLKTAHPAVYCLNCDARDLTESDLEAVLTYLESGGGVIVATTPWAFAKRYPDFAQSPGNRILSRAGLGFLPDSYCSNKMPVNVVRPIESIPPAERALAQKGVIPDSRHPAVEAVRALTRDKFTSEPATRDRLVAEMKRGKTLGWEDIPSYLKELQLLNGSMGGIRPTRSEPVTPGKFPIVDAIIEMETHFNLTLPPGMMYPIPAANDFPGTVPGFAPEVAKKLDLDCNYKGWAQLRNAGGWNAREIRPTGIYAAPGKVIKVVVPQALAARGYEVVIGSYGGSLDSQKKWHRYPRTQKVQPIRDIETEVSNAFGGLVGIRIPQQAREGIQPISLSGGVAAPLYIHGQTDLNEWRKTIRNQLAPWAELASERIIITVPADHIRTLENPHELMALWDRIIDKSAELAALDRSKFRAERLVFDRQPSAGLLHSGYPVCGHIGEDSLLAVNAEKLSKDGYWGFFHEYGHNHQHALWALPGTVETTCNLWSVFVYEELIGKPRQKTHPSISPLTRLQTRKKYFAGGADFEKEWSMWVALDTYLLIQENFGWQPFQEVFAEYEALPKEAWPKNQQEINDQWVIRLSKACGKNLAPYWKVWNLPLTPAVDEALKDLPVWQCPELANLTVAK